MADTDDVPGPVPATKRRVRAIIRGSLPQSALVLVNNRVIPGHPCIMLPGGGVEEGETALQALSRELTEEVGITAELSSENTRFILSRSYQFEGKDGGPKEFVELGFFEVCLPGVVPRNMEPESVVSVDFMMLSEVRRLTSGDDKNWHIQLGALDALEAVLDPDRNGQVPHGTGREISREEAPRDPRPKPLPQGSASQPKKIYEA